MTKQGDPVVDSNWFHSKEIIARNLDNGYPSDRELAKKHLEKGKIYTVKHTWVWSAHSEVELVEFPGIKFNTIHFSDVSFY